MMGRVMASVQVENKYGPAPMPPVRLYCFDALVDTGASHLVLPSAWRDKFGVFAEERDDETEVASQERVKVMLCGPAQVLVEGFSDARTDVLFLRIPKVVISVFAAIQTADAPPTSVRGGMIPALSPTDKAICYKRRLATRQ